MNSQRLTVLIKVGLKKLVREPATLFMMLLFPAVLTLAFGAAFGNQPGMNFTDMVGSTVVKTFAKTYVPANIPSSLHTRWDWQMWLPTMAFEVISPAISRSSFNARSINSWISCISLFVIAAKTLSQPLKIEIQ